MRLERAVQALVAGQQTRFQQRRLHRHILRGFLYALVHRAHRGADIQPHIPAAADECLQACLKGLGSLVCGLRQQQEDVDVGVREQLAAPVTAHRDQRAIGGHLLVLPELHQRVVHRAGQLGHKLVHVGMLVELRKQVRAFGLQGVAR